MGSQRVGHDWATSLHSLSERCFPGGLVVKSPFVKQETWVWFLGQENPLEKEMATHFNILAWEIPWMEEPGRLQSMGSQRIGHDWSDLSHACTWHPLFIDMTGNSFCLSSVSKESACNAGDPVWFLGPEDPVEKEMATHFNILAWKIPWTDKPGGLQSIGSQESDMT